MKQKKGTCGYVEKKQKQTFNPNVTEDHKSVAVYSAASHVETPEFTHGRQEVVLELLCVERLRFQINQDIQHSALADTKQISQQ